MTIQVSTTQYVFAHRKQPRGYGQWAFFFDGKTDVDDAQWFTGKYSEAKKMAVAFAVTRNHRTVEVGS